VDQAEVVASYMSKRNFMRKAFLASAFATVIATGSVTAPHAAKSFSYVTDTGDSFGIQLQINTKVKD
jgi:uncharacterized membrane protein